jgi:hypothetical protein
MKKIKKGGNDGIYKLRINYGSDNYGNDIQFIRNGYSEDEKIKSYNEEYLQKYTFEIEKVISTITNKQIPTTEKNNCIFTAKYAIPIFNKSTLYRFDKVYNLEREYPFYNLNERKVLNTFQDVIKNYVNSLNVIKKHYISLSHSFEMFNPTYILKLLHSNSLKM